MREITSKKNKKTQIITEDEWRWLVEMGLSKNFVVSAMHELKVPKIPQMTEKIIKPKNTQKQKQK